ncbi:MAG: hypothetical protein KGM42_09670 [Hyphomicrobiales bacterium]|nr:hypothetical protein [Hyphomicrobiales bacterium]
MRRIFLGALFSILAATGFAPAAQACDAETPCDVAHGRYFVRAPAVWDGRSPLPVAVFFHGYKSSAKETMADADLGAALSKAGVLLVAPDGLDGRWSAAPQLSRGRDDIAFAREVVADVKKRFPVDPSLLVGTGFSAGGFMVWRIACEAGDLFSAYAPVAGAFLDPIPADCPTGPVSVRHIHGKADETVPMAGRWIGGGRIRQSDVGDSIARMRALDGCAAEPLGKSVDGLDCQIWPAKACASGREIQLCLHADGHMMKGAWIADAFAWARSLARASAQR